VEAAAVEAAAVAAAAAVEATAVAATAEAEVAVAVAVAVACCCGCRHHRKAQRNPPGSTAQATTLQSDAKPRRRAPSLAERELRAERRPQ
jgi:hypothetical protein